MCGRLVMKENEATLAALFEIDVVGGVPVANWNVAPTNDVAIVMESMKTGEPVRRLETARWSLVPKFAKELNSPYPTFNARSETAAEKPTFRDSVFHHRALVVANAYYEWRGEPGSKTPYVVYPDSETTTAAADAEVLAFAGLYSWWRNPNLPESDPDRWVLTATILTTAATGAMKELHDRVPVVLAPSWWDTWLDPTEAGGADLVRAAAEASAEVQLRFHQVRPLHGNGPELVNPVENEKTPA